jgi:hypothetical protein
MYPGKPATSSSENPIREVEESVMDLINSYAKHHEVKGRNLACDR